MSKDLRGGTVFAINSLADFTSEEENSQVRSIPPPALTTHEARRSPYAIIIGLDENLGAEGSLYIDNGFQVLDETSKEMINFNYMRYTVSLKSDERSILKVSTIDKSKTCEELYSFGKSGYCELSHVPVNTILIYDWRLFEKEASSKSVECSALMVSFEGITQSVLATYDINMKIVRIDLKNESTTISDNFMLEWKCDFV